MKCLALLPILVLASCVAVPPTSIPAVSQAPGKRVEETQSPPQPLPAPAPRDSSPHRNPRFIRTKLSGIEFEAVIFDSRTHRLVVADQPKGPGSLWPDSRTAAKSLGGLAALNAGFFTPEGKPLGRLIASGTPRGSANRSSLGAGYFVEQTNGELELIRRKAFRSGRQALQTGPFLIENGSPVAGLSQKSSTARSFLATDGTSGWILARTGGCSLAQLASALSDASLGNISVRTALNLDGGRSSDLGVLGSVEGGPRESRPFWNKPVRNFLVLKPRE